MPREIRQEETPSQAQGPRLIRCVNLRRTEQVLSGDTQEPIFSVCFDVTAAISCHGFWAPNSLVFTQRMVRRELATRYLLNRTSA